VSLPWKLAVWALVCLGSVAAAAQPSDQLRAERVLGPEWKKMARTAGMVFSGTVLSVEASPANDQALPTIQMKLRVERAIAGVEAGQVLPIREWAGAWSMHRPMHAGEHVLLLLYSPSSLGFTSPVNGALGQIALDASATRVAAPLSRNGRKTGGVPGAETVSVLQLERAIRNARKE
jgi:hypothetical protein